MLERGGELGRMFFFFVKVYWILAILLEQSFLCYVFIQKKIIHLTCNGFRIASYSCCKFCLVCRDFAIFFRIGFV